MNREERFLVFLILFFSVTWKCFSDAQLTMMIGIRYRNYTNHQGALADGTCCDNPSLTAPNCPPDQCDTSFLPCATFVGEIPCKAYFETPTHAMVDDNAFVLQDTIGNQQKNTSTNLMVSMSAFSPANINFNMLAREISAGSKDVIANFSFVIDWVDTFFSEDLHWRPFLLKDAYAELGLDAVRQCKKRYFGPTCSVYCKPTHQYTCLNDGAKNCTDGWQGLDCADLVPYCGPGVCQNGGKCTNIHLGYVCTCAPLFFGSRCEYTVTTSPRTIASTTTSSVSDVTTESTAGLMSTTEALTTNPIHSSPRTPTTATPGVPGQGPTVPGTTIKISSSPATRQAPTPAPHRSISGQSVTTIVATSVTFGLPLLVLLLASAVYLLTKMKEQRSREKIQPASPPLDTRDMNFFTRPAQNP